MRRIIAATILASAATLSALTAAHAGTDAHVTGGGYGSLVNCCVPH
jgi:hypothetical protein